MKNIFILLFLFNFSSLSAQSVDQQLKDIRKEQQLMGMSALAVCHDTVVYHGSFGISDYARNIPATDSTMYRIASISKTVTATTLMILYDMGLFKLDDDISAILGYSVRNPNYPSVIITPRMLLSHTSSIQDCSGYSNFITDSYNNNPPPPLSGLLTDTGSYYSADMWQNKKPGTYFMYSNLNFGIIGTMVEKLSCERFDVFCKKYIFELLGITGSFRIQDIPDINNVAVLYRANDGIWQAQADNFKGVMPPARDLESYLIGSNALIFAPQSGLRISATDLSKFMMMQINGGIYKGVRILKESTVAMMHKAQWNYNGSNGDSFFGLFRSWGLGFQLIKNNANGDIITPYFEMYGHIGDAYGLISDMFFDVKNNFGIIFITNGSAAEFNCGHSSAFYETEEDVFNTLFENVIQPYIYSSVTNYLGSEYKVNFHSKNNSDHINLRFYLPKEGLVSCKIINILGEEVYVFEKYFRSYGRISIPIEKKGLPEGIYFCVIRSQDNIKTLKFNIEK